MNAIFKQVRRIQAFARWVGRNPPLRLARLAARYKRVRALALITQSLWLTPDRLADMRPMRQWGYLLACVGLASTLWSDAALGLSPDHTALLLQRTGEIGELTGWWRASQAALVATAMTVALTAALTLGVALCFHLDLAAARAASRFLKIPPPRALSLRYFILLVAGDVAAVFALFWLVLKAVSPQGLAALEWLNAHPWLGAPLFVIVGLAYVGGFVRWQLTLRERGRQIYGEGRRLMAYSVASLAVSLSVLIVFAGLAGVGHGLAQPVG
ncbi:hypothetical protein AS593_06885 [Caulobacter vibrioides]|nr:hypothetical protein AS593_06885 [Caulobacter vibrioides]